MKKSAKALIDSLVDAVQDYDTAANRGGFYTGEKAKAYRKARRELSDALRGKWPDKEVVKTCLTCRLFNTVIVIGYDEVNPACSGCVRDFGRVHKNWRRK